MHASIARVVAASEPAGDVTAGMSIEALFSEHMNFVWRALRHFGVAEVDLEDQTQEVFLIAHRRGQQDGAQHPRTWLYAIARRSAAAYRRRSHRRHEQMVETMPEGTDTRDPSARAEIDLLTRVFATLDEDKQSVFLLYEIEGMSMREVAEAVQCPVHVAYTRYYAARRELTSALEERR